MRPIRHSSSFRPCANAIKFHDNPETFARAAGVSSGKRESTMERGILILVLLLASAIVPLSLFFRYKGRELAHRERLAALEKGTELPVTHDVESGPHIF